MLYELENPSDPYVFEAVDRETAVLAVLSLDPMYGATARENDEENGVPILALGDPFQWFLDTFGREIDDAVEVKRKELAAALGSFMYGHFKD